MVDDSILVIAPDYANWIVLQSPIQLEIFEQMKQGSTIENVLKRYSQSDVYYVVTQIEARKLFINGNSPKCTEERSLHLYLTNKCNLSCPHCYMFSGNANLGELSTEEILKILYDYKTIAKGTRVTFSGGEPLVRSDFCLISQSAYELGLEVKLLTNGSMIKPNHIDTLANYLSSVQISIDGYSEESNSKIRGKGHFQKALSAIDLFVSKGVETSVAITPSYELLKAHVDDYISFAKELIEKYIDNPFTVKFTSELSSGRKINPTKEQNEEYASLIMSIQRQIYGEDSEFIEFVQTVGKGFIRDNCMFGVFSIASNGDVYYCPEVHKLSPFANVRKNSFLEICQMSKKAEDATSVTKLIPCSTCELKFICCGGCRIEDFTNIANINNFATDKGSRFERMCSSSVKEKFYNLMVRSNEYLFDC